MLSISSTFEGDADHCVMACNNFRFEKNGDEFVLRGVWTIQKRQGNQVSPVYETAPEYPNIQMSIDFTRKTDLTIVTEIIPYRTIEITGRWAIRRDQEQPIDKKEKLLFWDQNPTLSVTLNIKTVSVKVDNRFIRNGVFPVRFQYAFRQITAFSPMTDPRTDISRIGMFNQGATCYINVVIQVLFSIPEFVRILYRQKCQDPDSLVASLQRLFAWLQLNSNPASTCHLTQALDTCKFNVTGPQDAMEFYMSLLERIISMTGDNDLRFLMEFELVATRTSEDGSQIFASGGRSGNLITIYASEGKSVQEAISEKVSGVQNRQEWDACDVQIERLRNRFQRAPGILVFSLERYLYDRGMVLCPNEILFEEDLRVPVCVGDDCHDVEYKLFAIIAHTGSADHGHYVLFVRRDNREWILFNDENLARVSQERVFDVTRKQRERMPWHAVFYVRCSERDRIMKPLMESDIPEDVRERYQRDADDFRLRECEANELVLNVLLPGTGPCSPEDTFVPELHEIRVARTQTVQDLVEECARIAQTDPSHILVWKCPNGHPETYIDPRHYGCQLDWFSHNESLFIQEFHEQLDIQRLSSMKLVFIRFYTQDMGQPLLYLGLEVVWDPDHLSLLDIAQKYQTLAGKQLIVFNITFENCRQITQNVSIEDYLSAIAGNRQVVFLVFQERPNCSLNLYDDDVIDSKTYFMKEATNTYKRFLKEKYSRAMFVVLPNKPSEQSRQFRIITSGKHATQRLKQMIAFVMGEEDYDPNRNAMLLEYVDPHSNIHRPFKMDNVPNTTDTPCLSYQITRSFSEAELARGPVVRVHCFENYSHLFLQESILLERRMTAGDLVRRLKDNELIPETAQCRVYEVLGRARLVEYQMSSQINSRSDVKIDVIGDESSDELLCQVSQVQRFKSGEEIACWAIPFFFPLRRGETFREMEQRLSPDLQYKPPVVGAKIVYEVGNSTTRRRLNESSIPFDELMAFEEKGGKEKKCYYLYVVELRSGVHLARWVSSGEPKGNRPLGRFGTQPLVSNSSCLD